MNISDIQPRYLYEDENGNIFLILGRTKYGINIAPLSDSNIYMHIEDIIINRIYDTHYLCIDRVFFLHKSQVEYMNLKKLDKLGYSKFEKMVNAISNYYMGNIVLSDDGKYFLYREDNDAIKSEKKLRVMLSTFQDTDRDPIDVYIPSTSIDNTLLNLDEDSETDDKMIAEMTSSSNPIVKIAKELGIPVEEKIDEFTGDHELLIDLIVHRKSDNPPTGSPSEARYHDRERKRRYKRRWFTESEARLITTMNSNSVASKYECSKSIATDMIKNAKRIFGLETPSRNIANKFTCHFNNGKSVKDVANIYPDTPIHIIEQNYRIWKVNGNSDNNKNVIRTWKSIIENSEYDKMAEAVFNYTILEFAEREMCTMVTAGDIIAKLTDIISINPFTCSGFGALAFDTESLERRIADAELLGYLDDDIVIELYNTTKILYDSYVLSYEHHADILAGNYPIPDTVDVWHRDSFISLIWNRFNRRVIYNKNRNLSDIQKNAINYGTPFQVATLFMITYSQALNLIGRYRGKIK